MKRMFAPGWSVGDGEIGVLTDTRTVTFVRIAGASVNGPVSD